MAWKDFTPTDSRSARISRSSTISTTEIQTTGSTFSSVDPRDPLPLNSLSTAPTPAIPMRQSSIDPRATQIPFLQRQQQHVQFQQLQSQQQHQQQYQQPQQQPFLHAHPTFSQVPPTPPNSQARHFPQVPLQSHQHCRPSVLPPQDREGTTTTISAPSVPVPHPSSLFQHTQLEEEHLQSWSDDWDQLLQRQQEEREAFGKGRWTHYVLLKRLHAELSDRLVKSMYGHSWATSSYTARTTTFTTTMTTTAATAASTTVPVYTIGDNTPISNPDPASIATSATARASASALGVNSSVSPASVVARSVHAVQEEIGGSSRIHNHLASMSYPFNNAAVIATDNDLPRDRPVTDATTTNITDAFGDLSLRSRSSSSSSLSSYSSALPPTPYPTPPNSRRGPPVTVAPSRRDANTQSDSLASCMPSPPPASGSSYQSTASFRTNEEILFPESKLVQKDDMEARVGQYYLFKRPLGQGNFAKVYKCQHGETQINYAMKQIWKSADKRLVMEEVALMKKLDHPGIVKIYEFLETEREYYLVLELCERVLVKQDHKTGVTNDCKDEVECNDLFRQLVLGIEYMHGQGVVHRDIKPENLLLIRDRDTGCPILKISDFGISRVFQQGQDMMIDDRMGTRAFTAPELYRSGIDLMGHKQKHEAKATDIWSMGVTLYVMFHGKLPFHKSNEGPQYDYAHGRKDECKTASAELTDLLNRMLEPNPDKRIKMDEIRAHSWVTNGGLKPLKSKRENVGTQIKISDEEEKNAVRKTDFRKVQDMNRSYSGDQLSARFRDISQGSSSSSPPTRTSFPGFAHDLLEPLSSGEMLLNPVDQVLMIEDRDVVETRPVISSPPTSGRSDHFVTAREAAFEGDDDHLRSDSEDYGICF